MNKNRLAKFQRVTALFEVGTEVVLEDDGPDGPVLVWVSKLNPFEQEEARKDGSVGRARAAMVLTDPLSPEMAVFEQALQNRTKKDVVQALVYAKQNQDYVRALDDIRALADWQDKLLVLERGDEQLADLDVPLDDEERTRLAALNQEYMGKINELVAKLQQERTDELEAMPEGEVFEAYKSEYRETTASQGFLTEYKISEMYYSLRDCEAKMGANGRWDHASCNNHRDRLCDSRGDIRLLPEGLIDLVTQAIRSLTMSPGEAGNSDAPASSSASSERPSEAAAGSTPSTPTETSPEQAGTS
jgi:hypothetical protein